MNATEQLDALMLECGLSEGHQASVKLMGFTSVPLIGYAATTDNLEALVEHLCPVSDGETFLSFSPMASAVRRLIKACMDLIQDSPQAPSVPASPNEAPPKLKFTVAEYRALKEQFCQQYPGELLAPQTTPSFHCICLLRDQLDSSGSLWLPWKARTSELDEQIYQERRRPRSDTQLLKSLLNDQETHQGPEAHYSTSDNVDMVLPRFQTILVNALGILGKGHLLILKRFSSKFFEVATTKPQDPALRPPTLPEILTADRAVWAAVTDLHVNNSWAVNDSLQEVGFCPQDIHSLLQPRLRPHGPSDDSKKKRSLEVPEGAHPPKKGKGKGKVPATSGLWLGYQVGCSFGSWCRRVPTFPR